MIVSHSIPQFYVFVVENYCYYDVHMLWGLMAGGKVTIDTLILVWSCDEVCHSKG
jgi:hypothetical protein